MTNKIVILDNSVELYEHYIDDDRWERTLAFPRGGVTYLVSNKTIKFYAYEDYLYRNCIISMQLPIHVVDEFEHIDGEYEDIDELAEVLDRIFPTNDIDAELAEYLRIKDAELTYQPIGDYALKSEIPDVSHFVTDEDLVDALDDYYTKEEADEKFQPKGDYFDDAAYDTERKEIVFYSNGVEKDSIDARPFIKDGMVSDVRIVGDDLVITFNTDSGKEPISIPLSSIFNPSNYYTKDESDGRFQPKGDYVEENEYDAFTATTSADIEDLKNDKLDVTAYTPTDLSNYYTKQEVYNKNETYNRNEIDDKIAEAGSFDPTKYYTKTVSDNRFAFKSDIPSLDGFATEDWVLSKKYATASSVQQYITNLQQQINSIVEAVSGCCPTVETIYRWLTLTGQNDYICSGTTKYEKQVYQQSTDGGMTWTNVEPVQYRRGAVLETDSPDCGYVPYPQYRWKAAPASDYMCSGTSKYYKVYYEVSYDEGVTWEHVVPEQTRRGDLIEAQSTDCGYIPPKYRWYTSQSEYICSGTTKYQKQYYQVSYDNGQTWQNVSPLQTRTGSVIEYNSEDCGYVPSESTKYLTFIPSENGTFKFTGKGTVPNTASYSLDSGSTWTSLESGANTPTVTSGSKIMWKGSMIPDDMTPSFGVGTFSSTCKFAVEGNPMSLLYNDNFASQKSLSGKRHAFDGLFSGCTKLTSIDNIALPATTLETCCYQYMFEGCTSLISVPNNLLSATTLKEGCYCGMFKDCTSLTNMPDLNGTNMGTLARDCYNSMFAGCTSLTTAKKLPATDLGYSCYTLMFKNCTNLTTVPADMLPATTLEDYCYDAMFNGCSKLTTAPTLPAATLVYACYNGMFENCSKLNYIKCLATSINATYATTAWVKGVQTNSGTFVKNPNMNSWTVCDTSYYKGIPCNWTVQNA